MKGAFAVPPLLPPPLPSQSPPPLPPPLKPVVKALPLDAALPDTKELPDLARILRLPTRPVIDCERERVPGVRRWTPAAQALIDVVTAKYSRGKRIVCGCRDRLVHRSSRDVLTVFGTPPPRMPPPLPVEVTIEDFCRDNYFNKEACEVVREMRIGEKRVLPGVGSVFCITEFNPPQAWVLWEAPQVGGASGFLSVGSGKTMTGIMVPMSMPHVRKWAIFIKPDQRIHYRDAYFRAREHFFVPDIVFEDDGQKLSHFGAERVPPPVLHVIPYSRLSSTKSTQMLEQIDPDGAIFDESHLLANKRSSRTMRVLRFLANRNAQKRYVVVCDWSGSKVKKSLKDCAHLSAHALGLGSPYPIVQSDIDAMSDVIDPKATPDRSSPVAKMLLRVFGNKTISEDLFESGLVEPGIREGHRERVIVTPGIISTRSSSISCSITLKERKISAPVPKEVRQALAGVRNDMQRPDGEELVDATEIALTTHTVAAGFYFYWAFPHSTPEDRAPGGTIEQWYAARKKWNKEVRIKLLAGEPHLDSYKLCENAAVRAWSEPRYEGDLPVWPAESWPAWAAIRDKVQYDERVKWIDDYLARDAAEWAKEHCGIVWCQAPAFGRRVAELAGINYHGGGPEAEARIRAESGKQSIVASMRSHATGRDGLQYKFAEQLIADIPPASADAYEQLLGRLAREGQTEDTVDTYFYLHVSENRDALRRAFELAEFIEATTPNRQALLAADREFDL